MTPDDVPFIDRLAGWLEDRGIHFRLLEVDPDASPIPAGRRHAAEHDAVPVKTLLLKGDDGAFRLFALPGPASLDNRAARRALGLRKLRFARRKELQDLTGLVPGEVPPFGEPLLPAPLYADASLEHAGRILSGCGARNLRILVDGDDWRRATQPEFVAVTSDP
ncbi:MAG: aminoacyl-tRNA deacylase [Myxococcota bacterium]